MKIFFEVVCFLALSEPMFWEHENDKHGDFNKKADVFIRVGTALALAFATIQLTHRNFLLAFNLSMAMHFLVFDYWIAYTLIKNGTIEPPRGVRYHWFTYVAKHGFVDNVPHWKDANPWLKLGIRVLYFVGSVILYFIK